MDTSNSLAIIVYENTCALFFRHPILSSQKGR